MISLTDSAATKIANILNDKGYGERAAIRFAVKGGGCSGFEMEVSIEPSRKYDLPSKHDQKFVDKDIRILVDKKSLLFLDGTTVDYEETQFGHRFKYKNPNAKGWCGCGESFSI